MSYGLGLRQSCTDVLSQFFEFWVHGNQSSSLFGLVWCLSCREAPRGIGSDPRTSPPTQCHAHTWLSSRSPDVDSRHGFITGSAAASQTDSVRPSLRLVCSGQLRLLSRSSLTWGQNRTEPNAAAPDARCVAVAVRRPAAPGAAEPAAPANHAVRARSRTSRVSYIPSRIITIPIRTPFQHIPVHIVQTPRIRALRLHRMSGW